MKESKFYFIDTNIFLRVIIEEDKKTFKECFQTLEKIKSGEINAFTSSLVLAEVNWVLSKFYKFSKNKTCLALKSILNLKGLKIIDKHNPLLAVSIYEKSNVKFIDSLIASNFLINGNKSNIIILSYDKDFDKIGIKRKSPSNL